MVTGLIGKKVGMTQLFTADGTVQPATVVKAGPCVVSQVKTMDKDGYEAVQLGLVDARPTKENKKMSAKSGGTSRKGAPLQSDDSNTNWEVKTELSSPGDALSNMSAVAVWIQTVTSSGLSAFMTRPTVFPVASTR